MLRLVIIFCLFFANAIASTIHWMDNLEEAQGVAKKEKKYLMLFFTGSDWCGHCRKLESDTLSTTEFADGTQDQFVFVIVDFPLKKQQDPKVLQQNKELQKKYFIKGFPTILLLDDQLQQMGQTGYRTGGGKAYAEHIRKLVDQFKEYKHKVHKINTSSLKAKELQTLYASAKELRRYDDAKRILKAGVLLKDNSYFLLEKFRLLAKEGLIQASETQGIRQQLLAADPENQMKTHYEVAIIEFEAFTREKTGFAPEIAIAPLIAYIDRFGDNDLENTWRLQMIIAQVYLDRGKLDEAAKYLKESYKAAPKSAQGHLQAFIHNVQKEIGEDRTKPPV